MAIRKPKHEPRSIPPTHPLTADEFYALPETPGERYELYDGMLVMVPPPDFGHNDYATELVTQLRAYGKRHGGKAVGAPTGVALSGQIVFEPDAVYVSADRQPVIARRGIEGAPDLVVEVLSPSTRRYDLHTKLPAYLEHGVAEVWIVDTMARTVAVHRPGEEPVQVPFGERIPSKIVDIADGGLAEIGPEPGT